VSMVRGQEGALAARWSKSRKPHLHNDTTTPNRGGLIVAH
jgi:hypothetical protein